MKIRNILIAIAFLLIPVIARTLWFYQGIYTPGKYLKEPDFLELTMDGPVLSTPFEPNLGQVSEQTIVGFDFAHSNQYLLAEIEILVDSLIDQGVQISTLEEDEDLDVELQTASAFVSIAPAMDFTEAEVQVVQEFVARGGRLLVIADPTRSTSEYITSRAESVQIANKLLEPYDLTFRNDYAYNIERHEGNFRNVFLKPLSRSELTAGIEELVFYASRSLSSFEQNLVAGDEQTFSSLTDTGEDLCVAASSGDNVLAVGDMTFLTSPFYQVADNYQFVLNISQFLIQGDRQKTFADFPSVFAGNIGILPIANIKLDYEFLEVVSELQDVYARQDLYLEMVEDDDKVMDLILLDFLPPSESIDDYIEKFDIQFSANGSVINEPEVEIEAEEGSEETPAPTPTPYQLSTNSFFVPGIGELPRGEYGLFLLDHQEDRTILIVLANDQDDMLDLLEMLAAGSLQSCYTEGSIALCEQNNYGWKATSTPEPELEETPEELTEETPAPTEEAPAE